jgi:hypothetical protein
MHTSLTVACCVLLLLLFLRPKGGPAMAAASKAAFAAAIARLESVGGQRVEVDFSPFAEAAALLYQSSFVAERYSGIRAFLDKPSGGPAQQPEAALQQQRSLNTDQRLLPVTRAIISGSGGHGKGTADSFSACWRVQAKSAPVFPASKKAVTQNRPCLRDTKRPHQPPPAPLLSTCLPCLHTQTRRQVHGHRRV